MAAVRRPHAVRATWAVIGNGCVGSAVATSLAQKVAVPGEPATETRATLLTNVCLIGPGGPPTAASGLSDLDHRPSSHADCGRILRAVDAEADPRWVAANAGAMARVTQREEDSGVQFHRACGSVVVGNTDWIAGVASKLSQRAPKVAHSVVEAGESPALCSIVDAAGVRGLIAPAAIPDGYSGLFEGTETNAGYVNPLEMIRANNVLLEKLGGIRCPSAAVSLSRAADPDEDTLVCVTTASGDTIVAERVVVACGGLTDTMLANHHQVDSATLRVPRPFGYRLSKRTVLLAEVSEHQLPTFAKMPSIKFQLEVAPWPVAAEGSVHDKTEAATVYILPPIEYPDGKTYIKLGGGPNHFLQHRPGVEPAETTTELTKWMDGAGDDVSATQLKTALAAVFPTLEPASYTSKACFTTCSAETSVMEAVSTGRVAAVGMCHGKAAGPSLQLGDDLAEWLLSLPPDAEDTRWDMSST